MITPRNLFQKTSPEDAKKLALIVHEAWFERSIVYARAELSANGISAERLAGANQFLEILTTLADEQKPLESPPDKQLISYA